MKTYGIKATSETVYKKYLEKNFATIHGQSTPKWAQLQLKENLNKTTGKEKGNEQSDDGQSLTRVFFEKFMTSEVCCRRSISTFCYLECLDCYRPSFKKISKFGSDYY